MAAEFVLSEKGKKKLLLDGYLYNKDKGDEKVFWRCDYYYKIKCNARVTTLGNSVLKKNGSHNHTADAREVEKTKFYNKMRKDAINTQEAPHHVISTASSELSQATAAYLPKVSSLKRTIRNIRTKEEAVPALPLHRRDIVFPQEYQVTIKGEGFLLYDSGPSDDRMLVFSTRRNISLLAQSAHWYADGTFKTVPHLFCHLFTVHGLKNNISIPLVYVLLPDKTKNTYTRLLQKLKEFMPGVSPITILTDFETALVQACVEEFPASKHRGCFFHFSQCILRKIQTEGLIKKYETEPEFALKMKFLSALAFVPTTDVVEAFEILCDENMLPEDAQPILDYFEDTWIGRPQRRQHRRSPRFSHSMWNCFNTVVEGLPKTNNSIEGWHRAFEAQISADHPNIWKFVKAIQREQSLHELQIEQYVGGAAGPPARKKYRNCAERIEILISHYGEEPLCTYLRGIAHNLSY
nr:unnamed protein product [Callosobruchus analis]